MSSSLIIKLAVSIALPIGVGAVAGLLTAQAIPEWYATLNRPSFSPPDWVFGPVWTTLYFLLGISLFLIWKTDSCKERNLAILFFMLQLVLNFGWSLLFFYFKMIDIAMIEIVLLWIGILIMVILFHKIRPMAAFINIPYLLWVTFATILNAGYYFLNRN